MVSDDVTFPYRVALGLCFFGALGAWDLRRNPSNPRRLKEYAFLFGVALATMLYALAHDAVTFALGDEYFRVVKGLESRHFDLAVAGLALKAGWTAGLVIGLVFVVANNPSKRWRQLSYRDLTRQLAWPLLSSPFAALLLGLWAHARPDAWIDALDIAWLRADSLADVVRVWAVHIGSYLGAIAGLLVASIHILRQRRARPMTLR